MWGGEGSPPPLMSNRKSPELAEPLFQASSSTSCIVYRLPDSGLDTDHTHPGRRAQAQEVDTKGQEWGEASCCGHATVGLCSENLCH